MSASQAVSLTCSVAPGRRRVRGWGRRGAARARATCVRATCAGCGAACGPRYDMRFGFSSRHARTRRVFPICYLTRALIRLRPRTVTARDGTMPRTCGRKLTRSRRAERPRPGPGLQLYIYLASNTAAPPSFKTRAPHLTQTCIRAHTRCEASLAIGTKGAIERRGSVASILTILDGIKGSQPNHMRASPCF